MGSLAELIAAQLHSQVELSWRLVDSTRVVANFSIRTLRAEASFEQRGGPWCFDFQVRLGDEPISTAFRVFSVLFQAVREFIKTRTPEVVTFLSKNEDLAAIYQAYLRYERPSIEALGYAVEGPHRVDPYTEFTLRRMR